MNKQEYEDGYQSAIEAIRQALARGENGSGQAAQGNLDPDMQTPPSAPRGDTPMDPQDSSQGSKTDSSQDSNQGGKGSGQSSQGSKSDSSQSGEQERNSSTPQDPQGSQDPSKSESPGSGNQGVVRPEDCIGPGQLSKVPAKAGAMIDKKTGDDIAEQEGYAKEGGAQDAVEREWKDAAIKSTQKMKGSQFGELKSKILSVFRTTTDWKKELRTIVGHAISPEDKRQAYANKNILISQDRIARTEKDKYDNVDYIMAWIDSSGSMSDAQLRLCLSEVYAMALKKKPMKVITVQCDTRIQEIKEYRTLKDMQREFKQATVKGRGGTDLKPCWDLLRTDPKYKRIKPELVMIFTDGFLDQYKRDPRTMRNLCWVIIDNPGFNLEYKDMNTKVIYLNSKEVK